VKPILNPGQKEHNPAKAQVNVMLANTAQALGKANERGFIQRYDPEGILPIDEDQKGIVIFKF
jgi:hypothetical protein